MIPTDTTYITEQLRRFPPTELLPRLRDTSKTPSLIVERLREMPDAELLAFMTENAPAPKPAVVERDDEEEDAPAPEPRTPTPVEEDADGMPELLPFTEAPGYSVDAWGIPHAEKKKGRKAGKVRPDRYGYKGRWICRYRLRVDGRQKIFSPKYLMIARTLAERDWKQENEVSTTESR